MCTCQYRDHSPWCASVSIMIHQLSLYCMHVCCESGSVVITDSWLIACIYVMCRVYMSVS